MNIRKIPSGLKFWLWLLAALSANLPRAEAIAVAEITYDGASVRIEFTDQRLAANPGLSHTVEFARSLATPTAWTSVSGLTFLPLGSLVRSVNVPTSTPSGFYRIVASDPGVATPDDTDGDHIPNATELLLGTNPNLFDSDGDGFSDGVEYQYGTNPKDPASFPVLTSLPRAEFVEAISYGTEGSAPFTVKVRFDKPYFGTLNYVVLPQGTARPNVDFQPLPLSVTVAGTSVVIPITWIDDDVISPDRLLFLEIKTNDALKYARGGRTRHTVLLGENDAWWTGMLIDKYAQRNFQLKLVHIGGVTKATFVAGAGSDGLPLLPGDTGAVKSSQSVGVIPLGSFPAAVQLDTAAHFKISSPAMPAATGGLFGAGTGLTRTLFLEALPAADGSASGQDVKPGRVVGSYTECLAFPGQTPCAAQSGTFALVRLLPARPNVIP